MNSQLNFNPWYNNSFTQPYNVMNQMVGNNQQINKNDYNPIIWVQGENGAKAYPVPQGVTAFLFDSENNSFYLKTVDVNTNIPTISNYIYFEQNDLDNIQLYVDEQRKIQEQQKAVNNLTENSSQYVTQEQFVQFNNTIMDQLQQIQTILNSNKSIGDKTDEVIVSESKKQQSTVQPNESREPRTEFNFSAVQ